MRPGPTIRLRPVNPEDVAWFERWSEDDEVRSHYFGRASQMLAREEDFAATRGRTVLKAVETGTGELIGWIGLHDILWRRRCAELRVCLGAKEIWGRGFGTAAVATFLGQVFAAWQLDEVYLRVATWNLRAIRTYEKCGFRRVGVLRAGRRQAEGFEDLLLMTVSRDYVRVADAAKIKPGIAAASMRAAATAAVAPVRTPAADWSPLTASG